MLSSLSLEGKVALVTGATKGLGYGMARGLAQAGADLVVVSRNQDDCERVAAEIEKEGRRALAQATDLRDLSRIDLLVEKVVQEFGSIDILVNNAGAASTGLPEQVTEEEWDFVLDLNLKGAFFTAQRVGKQMIAQRRGKIINVASVFGFVGDTNLVAYCASKGGLLLMTRSLALAWARHNIQVNAVAPGYIETEMNAEALQTEKVFKHIMNKTPAKRLGQVEDVVGAVVFMSSPAADYMTGQSIVVDGGWLAH